ncbi:MAG: GNAT family N-acetyltransferase [Chitinophagales bacterium]
MTVTTLQEAAFDDWNAFVDTSPQCNLFAKTWYLQALNVSFEILICLKKEKIKGGIVLTKDRWGYYINPVLCKYLGIYFSPFEGNSYTVESRQREVQNALVEKLNQLGSFEYTFHPNYTNWMPFERVGFKQTTRYTYLIQLENLKDEEILAQLNGRLRNKILKANSFSIKLLNDFQEALVIFEATYKRQGIDLPISKDRLVTLIVELKKQNAFHLIGAYDDQNKLQAALGLFYDHKTAYLILNGVDSSADNGANEALIFNGIQWAKQKGLKTFDSEGSMIPSIESFYRQFGGELTPYFKIWKDSKQRTLRNLKQKIVN